MVNLNEIYLEVDNLDQDKIMDLMRTVISIDTTVPPGNSYREYVNTISLYFKELNYTLEEVIMPEELLDQIPYPLVGPRINLIATKDFGQERYITFYGHMDVVPAPNEGNKKWRFHPFEATMIKSGKIYGRGVADMKGAMVCLILALQIIEQLSLTPKYNIRVLNCTDEEIGNYPGIRYLSEQGYIKGKTSGEKDIVFCMDGVVNPIIPIGAAGDIDINVETIGRSCHSGINFLGVNALEEIVPILVELMKLKKIVEERESNDIPGFPRPKTGEKRNMMPMFNLNIIRSGEKSNIVPDLCTLTINRRIIPEEKYENVKQEILDAIERGKLKSKALDVRTIFKYTYPPLKTDPNSHASIKLKKVISTVQNIPEEEIQLIGVAGSTDMGFLTEYDVIIHGVANPSSNPHGVNETIKLKDIKIFIKELIVFLCADL
ncbi:MAG: M20 family metallopeptidase [Promethearchaeota archaeon]